MPPFHFPLEPGNKHRADTQALKARLQELLPGPEGREYWKAFGEFLTGQMTRAEFDMVVEPIFNDPETQSARPVHNLMVLAVLFNISQPAGVYTAPPKPKRGEGGWFNGSKRKRGGWTEDETPEERQRERTKEAVMALGKRERQRLKQLPEILSNPTPSFLQAAKTSPLSATIPPAPLSKASSSTLKPVDAQEMARWDSVLNCRQAEDIPSDPSLLSDRMSAIAHRTGLHSAAPDAGALLLDAVQMLQSGILQAIVDYQRNHHSGKLTLKDIDHLFQLHPDLVAPPSHPLSSVVETALTSAKQKRQLAHTLRSKQVLLPPMTQQEKVQQVKKERNDQHTDLAETLFPETQQEPARLWDVVDTKALFADLV